MSSEAIIPSEMQNLYDDWKMSPAIVSNGFAFLTGFSGASTCGVISPDAETQFCTSFEQIAVVLKQGGMGFSNIVEMTSYHIGLRTHLELFKLVRGAYVKEPYPAWTALEVAGFATEGVIIEIRIIAKML